MTYDYLKRMMCDSLDGLDISIIKLISEINFLFNYQLVNKLCRLKLYKKICIGDENNLEEPHIYIKDTFLIDKENMLFIEEEKV